MSFIKNMAQRSSVLNVKIALFKVEFYSRCAQAWQTGLHNRYVFIRGGDLLFVRCNFKRVCDEKIKTRIRDAVLFSV